MISLTLFSVTNEQSLIIATFIPIVIAVLAWVFPFPAIDSPKQESGNDNEEQQSKPQKLKSLLNIRIFVSAICLAISGMLIYKSYTVPEGAANNTPSPQEPKITSSPEITPTPTPEITPEPDSIIQQPQDLEVYPSDTAKFTVVASKAVKSYMWQYLKPGASWKNVTVSIFPSATTDTLTFIAHDSHNGFQYRCIVHFEDGTTEVSEPAKITVKSY